MNNTKINRWRKFPGLQCYPVRTTQTNTGVLEVFSWRDFFRCDSGESELFDFYLALHSPDASGSRLSASTCKKGGEMPWNTLHTSFKGQSSYLWTQPTTKCKRIILSQRQQFFEMRRVGLNNSLNGTGRCWSKYTVKLQIFLNHRFSWFVNTIFRKFGPAPDQLEIRVKKSSEKPSFPNLALFAKFTKISGLSVLCLGVENCKLRCAHAIWVSFCFFIFALPKKFWTIWVPCHDSATWALCHARVPSICMSVLMHITSW